MKTATIFDPQVIDSPECEPDMEMERRRPRGVVNPDLDRMFRRETHAVPLTHVTVGMTIWDRACSWMTSFRCGWL